MVQLTGVEIIVGLAAALLGPTATAWFGARSGLNGVKKDMAATRADVAQTRVIVDSIRQTQSDQGTALKVAQLRVDMIARHCEFIHDTPISEHLSRHEHRREEDP